MKNKKVQPLKTKLLKKLRSEARNRIGVFKFSDGKYRVVFDASCLGDVSYFNENDWKIEGDGSLFQVFDRKDEVSDTIEEAMKVCDYYRRKFILREVRRKKFGDEKRYY